MSRSEYPDFSSPAVFPKRFRFFMNRGFVDKRGSILVSSCNPLRSQSPYGMSKVKKQT